MTTTIIDKRCTASATDPPDPEGEAERMRRRQAVREAAARRDIELQPAVLAEQDIKASEERCDQAADEHSMAVAPLQEELGRLEQLAIQRIANREPPVPEADGRRAELVGMIAEANRELEATVEKEREIQAIARRKARRLREGHPPSDTILAALAKPPLVNPALIVRSFCCEQRTRWARARADAARRGVKIQETNLAGIQNGEISGDPIAVEIRLRNWQAELQAALDEQAAALQQSNEIHRLKMDE